MIVYMVKKKYSDKWGRAGRQYQKWVDKTNGSVWFKRHYAVSFIKKNRIKEDQVEIIEFELKEIK